jgi:hypothetical protein
MKRYVVTFLKLVEFRCEVEAEGHANALAKWRDGKCGPAKPTGWEDVRMDSEEAAELPADGADAPKYSPVNVRKLHRRADTPPTLQEVQRLVAGGGLVELMTLANGDQLLFDEEGQLKGLELNLEASELAGQPIVGDALVLQGGARWT